MEQGKKLVQEAEVKVLENSKNYGKRKNPDGSVTEYTSSKHKDKQERDSFETTMLDFLQYTKGPKISTIDEAAVELEMMQWIQLQDKSVDSLLSEANIPGHLFLDAHGILFDLELSTLVNIYCAKGKEFSCDNFKKEMADMEMKPLVYHKIYKVLNQWRTMASTAFTNVSSNSILRLQLELSTLIY